MKANDNQQQLQLAYARVYGLSGIMGSGKSTTASLFAKLGAAIIDADALARHVMQPEYTGYLEIRHQLEKRLQPFSDEPFYKENGSLQRQVLAKTVFVCEQRVAILNEITHPHIASLFMQQEKSLLEKIVLYDVPLLFENKIYLHTKANIVVYAHEELCLQRALLRTSLPAAEIKKRIAKQISIEEKKKLADYVIENQASFSELRLEVEKVWKKIQTREKEKT